MDQPDRSLAIKIIDSLGSSGTPPTRGFHYFTVGLDQQIQTLAGEYLDELIPPPSNGGTFKLVQGDFGCGKTHFLYCLLREARRRGYATALVQLSARECPFDKASRVYKSIAQRISLPMDAEERDLASGDVTGLPELLRRMADAVEQQGGGDGLQTWLQRSLRRVPVEVAPFRVACAGFLDAYRRGDDESEQILEQWLLGEDVPSGEYRRLGVFAAIDESNALGMITSMTQVIRSFEVGELRVPGVVLAFDEMDRTLSISPKRSQTLLDNLRRLIDSTVGGGIPGAMMLYAVPPDFMRKTVADYPALKQRLHSTVEFGPANPSAPVIDLENLGPDLGQLLTEIGLRILMVYRIARGADLSETIQKANAESLARVVAGESADSGPRRAFVKAWVAILNGQVAAGERILAADEVSRLASGYLEESFPDDTAEATYQDL